MPPCTGKEKDFSSFPFSGDKFGEGVEASELVLLGVKVTLRLSDELAHAKANAIKRRTAKGDALIFLIVYLEQKAVERLR